ncbi:MAG TPA: hypothetical protein VMU33_10730, partial [Burkholderiaceae bacterium]|nr:hypothetical protein [Burkholderiaceae bacterium]
SLNTAQNADAYLRKFRGTVQKRLLAATPHSWKVGAIADYAAVAGKASKSGRLALIALPDRAYELAVALDRGEVSLVNERGEMRGVRVVPIPPWTPDAVHFYLDENVAVSESADACDGLLEASCGFGQEVARLCAGHLTVEAAKAAPAAAEKNFAPDLASLYKKIGMPDLVDASVRTRMEEFLTLLDDGAEKRSAAVDEVMQGAGIGPGTVQFLVWMGLLQDGAGNTWKVPRLVRRMLR